MKESDIQRIIVDYLNYRKDIYFVRNNTLSGRIIRKNGSTGWVRNSKPGAPDIIVCYKGRWIGLEIKNERGRQSPEQKQAEQDIVWAGGEYWVVRSLEEVMSIL